MSVALCNGLNRKARWRIQAHHRSRPSKTKNVSNWLAASLQVPQTQPQAISHDMVIEQRPPQLSYRLRVCHVRSPLPRRSLGTRRSALRPYCVSNSRP
jgi:hypothetical protein